MIPLCPRSGWEYQSEVGLLSRSILLQAEQQAEWDLKGAHVRVEGKGRLQVRDVVRGAAAASGCCCAWQLPVSLCSWCCVCRASRLCQWQ